MKKLFVYVLSLLIPIPLLAQPTDIRPLGVWNGTLDGMPGVTLTIADDTGGLGGTVVFYAVNGRTKQILGVQQHLLLQPALDGNTLLFQIKLRNRSGLARVKVVFLANDKAQLHCLDCGSDSPIAELTRQVADVPATSSDAR